MRRKNFAEMAVKGFFKKRLELHIKPRDAVLKT